MYVASPLEEEDCPTPEVPKEVADVLKEYQDVMPSELPKKLPPRREVDHQIELENGAKPPDPTAWRYPS